MVPKRRPHRYTQMQEARYYGMDAKIQRPGKAQTLGYYIAKKKHMYNSQVTVHGTGFRHP